MQTPEQPISVAERREIFLSTVAKEHRIPRVGHPDRPAALKRLMRFCRAQVRDLKRADYSINTVRAALVAYRKAAVADLDPECAGKVLRYLTLTREEWALLRQETEKKVNAESTSLKPINPDRIFTIAREQLLAGPYVRQAAALMALTGRRSIEILKTGSFEPIPGSPNQVMFSGQAKLHHNLSDGEPEERGAYPIIVFDTPERIIKALAELRGKVDFTALDSTMVNNRCQKTLNESVFRFYGKDEDGRQKLTAKDFRSIYALTIAERCKPENYTETAIIAANLGHGSFDSNGQFVPDLTTSKFYFDFRVVPADYQPVIQQSESNEIPGDMVGEGAEVEDEDESAGAKP